MLFTHIMAFSPLMCLSFSLCFVGRSIHCFFIAKCLLRSDGEFCSGKFRLLLTLLLLRVSSTVEICTILTVGGSPLRSSVPGSRGAVGAGGNQPPQGYPTGGSAAVGSRRAGERERGTRPSGTAANPRESPAAPTCLQKLQWDSTRNGSPQRSGACSAPTRPAPVPAARSGNTGSAPTQGWPRRSLGSHSPQPTAIPPAGVICLGRHSPVLSQDLEQAFPEPEKHFSTGEKFWFGGDSNSQKGNGFYSQYLAILLSLFVASL